MNAPKPPRGRPALPDERRDAILDAALACFVTQGFHGTAVPEISRRAGIATGTLYHYFPSKEAIVNALFRKWKEAIGARVLTAFPPGVTVREQFSAVWRTMADFALNHPEAFAFLELHHHRPYLDADSLAMENRLKEFGATMVSAAQAEGVIKQGSTTLLMELAFGAFNGMMRAHYEGRLVLTDELRRLAEEACWDIVAAR